ncbi:hypothetical protein ACWEK5_28155 [Rhodococcus koreensis]
MTRPTFNVQRRPLRTGTITVVHFSVRTFAARCIARPPRSDETDTSRLLKQRLVFWSFVDLTSLGLIGLGFFLVRQAINKWGPEAFWSGIGKFATSPGFGGVMAVGAAVIALIGVTAAGMNARAIARDDRNQDYITAQQEKWWEQAHWALDLVVKEGESAHQSRALGYDSLKILLTVEEKYRPMGAAEMVRGVTNASLSLPEGTLEKLLMTWTGAILPEKGPGVDPEVDPGDNPSGPGVDPEVDPGDNPR